MNLSPLSTRIKFVGHTITKMTSSYTYLYAIHTSSNTQIIIEMYVYLTTWWWLAVPNHKIEQSVRVLVHKNPSTNLRRAPSLYLKVSRFQLLHRGFSE